LPGTVAQGYFPLFERDMQITHLILPESTSTNVMTMPYPVTLSRTWNTNGNVAIVADVIFLGTTDFEELVFRTGNFERMRISKKAMVCVEKNLDVKGNVTGLLFAGDGLD